MLFNAIGWISFISFSFFFFCSWYVYFIKIFIKFSPLSKTYTKFVIYFFCSLTDFLNKTRLRALRRGTSIYSKQQQTKTQIKGRVKRKKIKITVFIYFVIHEFLLGLNKC